MAKKAEPGKTQTNKSGPRAPAGKKPLTAIIDEEVIKEAKIEAIRQGTNLSRVTQELLQGWLAGTYKLRQ
ncbi:hypothetical protein QCM77_25365 [Bradyrhizobium sp. SSUT18]|uniref:hypothetical protein n=1 Tax=Bradyrhizobium sp. SSUT18 TaxID=3040602 RepID=UPI00244961A5|nr:hypothetical protein [Bradyrhizobium sp. SSUT18]MDH2403250.1 hypothetical protein [Bradyrhizobium sp. SSUT18]